MKNYREIMRGSRFFFLALVIAGLLAGCKSKKPDDPTSSVNYTLTLDANGGDLATGTNAIRQVTSGEKAQKPADPTRTNYTFLGWTLTKDGSNFFNFDTEPITADLTLYAKWQDNSAPAATYAVTFDANGGALGMGTNATQQIASGSRATPPAAAPTRARDGQWDFAFVYWSADKRTRFDFTAPVTQVTTLYALWSVAIPDTNFRNKLKMLVPLAFDGDRLVVSHASVTGLTSMLVFLSSISDLSGIEFFTSLTFLSCGNNQLASLDVTRNTALTFLSCNNNQLASLDVTRNTALTSLSCNNNQLAALDVSRNTDLTSLDCSNNRLAVLDVSGNTDLASLRCSNNQLTALDVKGNTALTGLDCYENRLTALDVTQNTTLTRLYCYENRLTVLDVTQNTTLLFLRCDDNQLAVLDVSGNTDLTWLNCSNNRLAVLDVSGNTDLTSLDCSNNRLAVLDVSGNTALTHLYCYENQLTALDVTRNTALTALGCSSNRLTVLDVTQNTALTVLSCNDNQLTTLNVSRNTSLTGLGCSGNQLTTLDVSRNTALTQLYCHSNRLAALDIRGMSVSYPSLSLSNNPNLVSVKVHTNLKDNIEMYRIKNSRGNAVTIEVYDAPAGSTAYINGCRNYQPGLGGTAGACLTP